MTDVDGDLGQRWYECKSAMMEEMLGKEHHIVMHAMIPYAVGGALDLYYYPNGDPGTGIATKELCELPNEGSSNDEFSCYELVMFTRHELDLDAAQDDSTPFGRAHGAINRILNYMARYSTKAKLNPNDTCEFPADMAHVGGRCLIFDEYGSQSDDMVEKFGLLTIMEVFRSEMDYARENGTTLLLDLLKAKGHHPYSDMDREPVV